MSEDRYVVNVNNGVDVIHHNPREECNTDQAEDAQRIDELTATHMIAAGHARKCEHCMESEAT